MEQLALNGGALGIMVIAVILILKTVFQWFNEKSSHPTAPDQSQRDYIVQSQIQNILQELKIAMVNQANALNNQTIAQERMAEALVTIAKDITSVKYGIESLPRDISNLIKHKGNGHG